MGARGTEQRIKTDSAVRAAKADPKRQVEYRVDGVRGLALRVSPAGAKTWTLRYRTRAGEQRRHTIGAYPDIGLADARKAAEMVLGDVAGGGDPAKTRREVKAAARSRKLHTFSDLLDAYFEDSAVGKHRPNARPKRASTIAMERGYADRFLRPKFGKTAVADVHRHDVRRLIDDIEANSTAVARITRNVIRQVFNYAIRSELVSQNPAQFAQVGREASRERVLSDDELRAAWKAAAAPDAIKDLDVAPATGLALCFAILTLQRGGEIVGLHSGEIDRKARTWTIPGGRTKNHRTHVVPLSKPALDVLGRAYELTGHRPDKWDGFAFPSPRDGKAHIDRRALSRALAKIRAAIKLADITPHDFRRTGSTNLTGERIGVSRFIVSRVLNQISDTGGAAAATGVYDRNEYLPEKRRALDAWAELVLGIVAAEKR
jgi:integrase